MDNHHRSQIPSCYLKLDSNIDLNSIMDHCRMGSYLVGGIPTPLKNDGVRQLGL